MPEEPTLGADSTPQLRWIDAFPWVPGAARATGRATGNTEPWWLESVGVTARDARKDRLAALSDMALACMTKWSLGELFPLLPQSPDLTLLPLTNRAKNALMRRGYRTVGDIQGMLLMDLLDLPNVGIGTVDSILCVLAESSTDQSAFQTYYEADASSPAKQDRVSQLSAPTLRIESFADDLQVLASWYATLGFPELPLLAGPLPVGSPSHVIKARERLQALSAVDALPTAQAELNIPALLQAELQTLDDRAIAILTKRFFADRPQTLDEVGREHGLTRERVRQIESKARSQLVQALEADTLLNSVGATVRELIGTVLPLSELLRLAPALADQIETVGQPAWRVLDRLDGAYEIEDGWCMAPSIQAAKMSTQTRLLEHANKHGVVSLSDFTQPDARQLADLPGQSARDWLAYCGYEIQDGWVFTRTSSLGDRAAAILLAVGSPLSSQEIHDRLPVDRSLTSLKNAMGTDDRFERVDRDKWALVEWGMESYGGIRGLIRQELARSGGEVPTNALIERITGKYSVSANSVIAYASSLPFESRGGMVRFATGDRDAKKTPYRTRHLYRQGSSWLYRIQVTGEHLRGSGSPAPVALATALGIQQGTSCQLDSAHGPQSLGWTAPSPAFGTIRRLLVDKDIETGKEIFIVIADDRSFDIRPVDDGETDPLARALYLVGCDDASTAEPLAVLARAISLPENSPITSIIGGYRERGDTDVADLLMFVRDRLEDLASPQPPQPDESPEIDDILDLL